MSSLAKIAQLLCNADTEDTAKCASQVAKRQSVHHLHCELAAALILVCSILCKASAKEDETLCSARSLDELWVCRQSLGTHPGSQALSYSGDKKSLKLSGIEDAAADGPATKAQWDSGTSAHDLTQLFRRCLMTSQSRLSLRRKRQQLSPHMAILC